MRQFFALRCLGSLIRLHRCVVRFISLNGMSGLGARRLAGNIACGVRESIANGFGTVIVGVARTLIDVMEQRPASPGSRGKKDGAPNSSQSYLPISIDTTLFCAPAGLTVFCTACCDYFQVTSRKGPDRTRLIVAFVFHYFILS